LMLKPILIPTGPLKIDYVFWFSNKKSDIDNPIKPFQDVLCKKYWFDDSQIYCITVQKKIVKKWDEFVAFSIEKYI
jgi:Holliday junction resolvase RusA-like endonuclease